MVASVDFGQRSKRIARIAQIPEGNPGTTGRQTLCYRQADARGAAGNHGSTAGEINLIHMRGLSKVRNG